MSSLESAGPPVHPAPAGDAPAAHRPLRRLTRPGWWVLACLVLALALGFGAWNARHLIPKRYVQLPAGAAATDGTGASFSVLAREQLDAYRNSSGQVQRPLPGAVFLRFTVQVDDYSYLEEHPDQGICTFHLVNEAGQQWETADIFDPLYSTICDTGPAEITASQQVFPIYQVPADRVDEMIGLAPTSQPDVRVEVISEPDAGR